MSNVYSMSSDGSTKGLTRIACADEDKELQTILEHNLDLLPGDQITPNQNLRWLLIKREMPVPNPALGNNSWSIDFLLVDQYGVPTFVECKRGKDTRNRREVVGQMLEYAANGRHYWTASEFRSYAQDRAGGEAELRERLADLTGSEVEPEEFFASIETNLQRSKMRLIFFLDDSPHELRSIVEFLNGQMKDMEVLIVEARQYQHDGIRIIVPWVFGFTEEARVAKRESNAETVRSSVVKGEPAFWEALAANRKSTDDVVERVRNFVKSVAMIPGCEVTWQRSCIISLPGIVPREILLAIRRDIYLELYLDCWTPKDGVALTEQQERAHTAFVDGLKSLLQIESEQLQKRFPQIPPEGWLDQTAQVTELIRKLTNFRDAQSNGYPHELARTECSDTCL